MKITAIIDDKTLIKNGEAYIVDDENFWSTYSNINAFQIDTENSSDVGIKRYGTLQLWYLLNILASTLLSSLSPLKLSTSEQFCHLIFSFLDRIDFVACYFKDLISSSISLKICLCLFI